MKEARLIEQLEVECRSSRESVVDFLNALGDLCIDALQDSGYLKLGHLGILRVRPIVRENGDVKTAVRFEASRKLRARLNITTTPWEFLDLCGRCKKRPVRKMKTCASCAMKEYHERRRKGES